MWTDNELSLIATGANADLAMAPGLAIDLLETRRDRYRSLLSRTHVFVTDAELHYEIQKALVRT
jgi:hypothetical protein